MNTSHSDSSVTYKPENLNIHCCKVVAGCYMYFNITRTI